MNNIEKLSSDQARALVLRNIKIDRAVYWFQDGDEFSDALFERYEAYQQLNIPLCLIVSRVSNFDGLGLHAEALQAIMTRICSSVLKITRPADIVAQIGAAGFAALLVGCDQNTGAKICQRFKEAIHSAGFLSKQFAVDVEFDFGIADNVTPESSTANELIDKAYSALVTANKCGNGAIIRASDLDHSERRPIKREHFMPGESKNA